MRIGTNHGSLSDRILSRYGDTPVGMVESAFEFLQICEDNDYHEIVLSMKASNTLVMIQAYRLLMKDTVEEKIRILQQQKRQMMTGVLGEEGFARNLKKEDLAFLFEADSAGI